MTLDELDIEDVEEGNQGDENVPFDEETYEKPWITNPYAESGDTSEEDAETDPPLEEDIVTSLLKSKRINPSSVKFQTETGDVEEKAFDELTKEEQLQILTSDEVDSTYGLGDEEIDLINELRGNNLSVEAYKDFIGKQAIQDYLSNEGEESIKYEVDSIEDDELYLIDLKVKIPEISDEDAITELELAKQNEGLYQKKVQGIRNEYKKKEELMTQEEEEEQRIANENAAQEFEDTIITALQDNDTIDIGDSKISLSEDDMNEIASFILDADVTGVRHIAKALNDPKELVGMVWYALKGKEAFGQISDYYKQKITEASKTNYNKGYEDAKNGTKPNAAKSVVKKPSGNTAPSKKVLSINDLD